MARAAARSLVKREKILEIAAALFLEHGYEGVSLDEVTRRVGGSKTNVYTHFGSKEGLFAAVIEALVAEILTPLKVIDFSRTSLEEALAIIARTYLHMILSRRALALYRIIVAESGRFPNLGKLWFTTGPENTYRTVETYIAREQRAGRLRPGDPRQMAVFFLDMITFEIHHRTLLGVGARPSARTLEKLAKGAVRGFLHGYAIS